MILRTSRHLYKFSIRFNVTLSLFKSFSERIVGTYIHDESCSRTKCLCQSDIDISETQKPRNFRIKRSLFVIENVYKGIIQVVITE